MRIRHQQLEVLHQQAGADFEERAVKHLRRDLPQHSAAFSDEEIKQRTRECMRRAAAYDLVTERQIICFVDVSFLLDSEFDTKEEYAWAQKILRDRVFSPADRANLLLATACSVARGRKAGS